MGYCTIVSDGNPNAPGCEVSNYKIIADTYNIYETLRKVKHFHDNIRTVDGVIKVYVMPGCTFNCFKYSRDAWTF